MITVTPLKKSKSGWIAAAVVGSFFVHGGLFWIGEEYVTHRPKPVYEAGKIEFTAPPPPEPTPEPPKEPEPEPKELPPPLKMPRPNTQKPVPSAEPPKPIFGATADSVGDGDSSVAIRVGNTLEDTMSKEAPAKQAAAPLPPSPPAEPERPAPKAELKPVPLYNLSQTPAFKTRVEPVYPEEARRAEVEGVVQLEVLIDEKGRVRHITILQTPGGGLEKAAVSALSKSLFAPGMVNGKPVPVKIKIPYRFMLDS